MECHCEAVFAEAIPTERGKSSKLEVGSTYGMLLAKHFLDLEKTMFILCECSPLGVYKLKYLS